MSRRVQTEHDPELQKGWRRERRESGVLEGEGEIKGLGTRMAVL